MQGRLTRIWAWCGPFFFAVNADCGRFALFNINAWSKERQQNNGCTIITETTPPQTQIDAVLRNFSNSMYAPSAILPSRQTLINLRCYEPAPSLQNNSAQEKVRNATVRYSKNWLIQNLVHGNKFINARENQIVEFEITKKINYQIKPISFYGEIGWNESWTF